MPATAPASARWRAGHRAPGARLRPTWPSGARRGFSAESVTGRTKLPVASVMRYRGPHSVLLVLVGVNSARPKASRSTRTWSATGMRPDDRAPPFGPSGGSRGRHGSPGYVGSDYGSGNPPSPALAPGQIGAAASKSPLDRSIPETTSAGRSRHGRRRPASRPCAGIRLDHLASPRADLGRRPPAVLRSRRPYRRGRRAVRESNVQGRRREPPTVRQVTGATQAFGHT
jgi:hypothetical protein